jgi:plastocyanin
MRKYLPFAAVVVVIAAIVIGLAVANKDNNKTTNPAPVPASNPSNMNNSSPSPTPTSQATSTDKVTISNLAFSPANITVKKGTKVTWTNNDTVPHTVTADSGTGPNSQTLNTGDTYSFTYDSAGTFAYHCSIHHSMSGTVTVTE